VLVAAGMCLALATSVLLPGVAGVVVSVAVELDRQSVRRPAAVDAPPTGGAVRFREGKARGTEAGEEAGLEPAEDDVDVAPQDFANIAAPGLFGRRARTASTAAGVVRWRTSAS